MTTTDLNAWRDLKAREADFKTWVRGKRVAVVGNASSMLNFERGAYIDEHDVVIRCNKFDVTEKFRPFVGQKTDAIVTALNHPPGCPSTLAIETHKPTWMIGAVPRKVDPASSGIIAHQMAGKFVAWVNNTVFIPNDLVLSLYSRLKGMRPTTGCMMLHYLIERCECASIYLTGFSYEQLQRPHYHAKYGHDGWDYALHSPNRELKLFKLVRKPNVEVDPHIESVLKRSAGRLNVNDEYAAFKKRNFADYGRGHQRLYTLPLALLQSKGKRYAVLDVGCGIGFGLRKMLEANFVSDYYGIEPTTPSFNYCSSRWGTIKKVKLVNTDWLSAVDVPVCDYTFCIEVAQHVIPEDHAAFVAKLRAHTGTAMFFSVQPYDGAPDYARLLTDAGFNVARVGTSWSDLYVCEVRE